MMHTEAVMQQMSECRSATARQKNLHRRSDSFNAHQCYGTIWKPDLLQHWGGEMKSYMAVKILLTSRVQFEPYLEILADSSCPRSRYASWCRLLVTPSSSLGSSPKWPCPTGCGGPHFCEFAMPSAAGGRGGCHCIAGVRFRGPKMRSMRREFRVSGGQDAQHAPAPMQNGRPSGPRLPRLLFLN